MGDVWYCDAHDTEDKDHSEQYLLDQIGFGSGFFGDQHKQVLEVVRHVYNYTKWLHSDE